MKLKFAIISRPIENQVKDSINITPAFATVSFGISYESDKSYFLWMPTAAGDTVMLHNVLDSIHLQALGQDGIKLTLVALLICYVIIKCI